MTHILSAVSSALLAPSVLHAPTAIAHDPATVPDASGIYGWWFDEHLPVVPREGALRRGSWCLLYVGIAPNGARRTSGKRTLRDRLKNHCRGPMASSTLRRTVAALTVSALGYSIVRTGANKLRMPPEDEQRLSLWLGEHARVSWVLHDQPWEVETQLVQSGPRLPMNISQSSDPFRRELSKLRSGLGRR